ncbi:tetratricopeptide (TPR) repeat protein [Bradyrhizobium sp. F1.4.3]|uniref:tetratricopeptide repeat protein n=1 Tax=Bradyrhizobium sp. F1.4.3 TaxID=3156356 RepID=UPI003390A519
MQRFDLGDYTRSISTFSAEAQSWFDAGLNWCYAFNKAEGVKCFKKALEYDLGCVMAHWGMAYGSGPFYNLTWRDHGEREANAATATAFEHVALARSLTHNATDIENRLIEAQAVRVQKPYAVPPEEFDRWDDDYAAEMRRVHREYPDDPDVTALFVEALITRTPRRLWDVKTGRPANNSDVLEALLVCERGIDVVRSKGGQPNPALLHLHIHILEMSNEPERAKASAATLAFLCPDGGHLNHMPAHVHMLVGDYQGAKQASELAIAANDRFLAYAGTLSPYTTACAHDLLLMMHACMFLGRYGDAIGAANKLSGMVTEDVLAVQDRPKFVTSLEGYNSMRTHVLVRFGKWKEIIGEPMPATPAAYPVTTAMLHYAKGVAHATLRDFTAAECERALFLECVSRIPPDRKVFNNTAKSILSVAESMLEGELAYHKGQYETAFAHLREAVLRDDGLEYVEPWAWMHPPRHALGALLAEQGHFVEAECCFRDDLGLSPGIQRCAQHPNNVWALQGLAECLQVRGAIEELEDVKLRLAAAKALSDTTIVAACMCRAGSGSGSSPKCCG